ncbi:hypothetical protein C3K47_14105 [Solitalea longa]|uniref:Uncharacterized protein n=1 Tax=Solitalea longa TaxID=2079460 RepID=A0A2S5A0T3_9SPHI|nr:hypothetical protein [Solitalea longa]POY35877.1 hypothetical protein C3K47_14105 [Solitalea longa]
MKMTYLIIGAILAGGLIFYLTSCHHENVSKAAKQFIDLSQTYLNKATKTQTTTLPTADQVKFYLLTNNGVYVGQDIMQNFEDNSSEWAKLFEEANKVLTELRQTTTKYN